MRRNGLLTLILAGLALAGGRSYASVSATAAQAGPGGRVAAYERHWKARLSGSLEKAGPASVLAGTGSVSGTVSGPDADAMGTAYVETWPVKREPVFDDSTIGPYTSGATAVNPDGSYRIEGLLPGPYMVYAHADGYEARYFNDVTDAFQADTVWVREGVDAQGIDFVLPAITPGTGSIGGVAVNAGDGHPIADAAVYAFSSDQPYGYGKTTTDETGAFVISELKTGSYVIQAYADGYVEEIYDGADSFETATRVELTEPLAVTGVRIALDPAGAVSGTVVDGNGKALPNVWVIVIPSWNNPDSSWTGEKPDVSRGREYSASTDESGAYRVEGLPSGEYIVRAAYWDAWVYAVKYWNDAVHPSAATVVPVTAGNESEGIDFRFDVAGALASVSGRVTDAQGHPITGAGIQVFTDFRTPTGMSVWLYTSTDPDGRYRVDNVPQGNYLVSCWTQSGWQYLFRYYPGTESIDAARAVAVTEDGPAENVDFRMPVIAASAAIEGVVRTADGRSLSNAFVQVNPPAVRSVGSTDVAVNVWAYAYSDSFGFYRVENLPAGTYAVGSSYWENMSFGQEWYDGAASQEEATPVTLADGESRKGVDFSLNVRPIYGTIAGSVTDAATGAVLPRSVVEIQPVSFAGERLWFRWWNWSVIADDEGRYRVDWLPEGLYRVLCYAEGGFAYWRSAPVAETADTVTVTGGETFSADFAIAVRKEGPGEIRGTVSSEYGYETVTDGGAVRSLEKTLTTNPVDRAVVVARPSVTILSWPESERFYNTLTGADGSYSLTGLPEGEYHVQSFANGFMPEYWENTIDPAEAELVTVVPGAPAQGVDFSLAPMMFYRFADDGAKGGAPENNASASVRGSVTDKEGRPVSGAVVYLLNAAGQAVGSTNTGSDGSYTLNGVGSGGYYLQAGKLGYRTAYNGNASSLGETQPVFMGNSSIEVNFSLAEGSGLPPGPDRLPDTAVLMQGYPNPFNPAVTLRFGLDKAGRARLTVVNVNGRPVRTLREGRFEAGFHNVSWDARDDRGAQVPSGLYLVRLEAENAVRTSKVVYMK